LWVFNTVEREEKARRASVAGSRLEQILEGE
jgi:hypothetical protein